MKISSETLERIVAIAEEQSSKGKFFLDDQFMVTGISVEDESLRAIDTTYELRGIPDSMWYNAPGSVLLPFDVMDDDIGQKLIEMMLDPSNYVTITYAVVEERPIARGTYYRAKIVPDGSEMPSDFINKVMTKISGNSFEVKDYDKSNV
jgi:hypothetical protein